MYKRQTDKGLMNGTDDNQFSPSATTTRAMLMTVLARYAGEDTTGGATWYEKGMDWAKAKGVSDGTNPVSYTHLATMIGFLPRMNACCAALRFACFILPWYLPTG